MYTEHLKVFDEEGTFKTIASREEIHKNGWWHETFHCWILSKEKGKTFIHFQLRSDVKKDYPALLDISAAGHLLASENVQDGIREVQEELGVAISFKDLISLGTVRDEMIHVGMNDKEFAHVFMYMNEMDLQYQFQVEEVSGMFKIEVNEFEKLWTEKIESVEAEGIILRNFESVSVSWTIYKRDFVPHEDFYILELLTRIKPYLN